MSVDGSGLGHMALNVGLDACRRFGALSKLGGGGSGGVVSFWGSLQ